MTRKKLRSLISAAMAVLLLAAAAVLPGYAVQTDKDDPRLSYPYTIGDATAAQRILADFPYSDERLPLIYDVNYSGALDIDDVTQIQRHCAQLIDIHAAGYPFRPRTATYLTPENCSLTLGVDETFQLHYSSDAQKLTYQTYNPAVLSVTADGLICPKSIGTATVVCKADGVLTAECYVTVGHGATSLWLNASSLVLLIGEQYDLDSYIPKNTVAQTRPYTSDDPGVASVQTSGGLVTAVSEGKTTVRCTLQNGLQAVCAVTVVKELTRVNLSSYSVGNAAVGKEFVLTASTEAGSDENRSFGFTSSDPSVVAVSAVRNNTAVILPKSLGTAEITASLENGISAVCRVTVTDTAVQCIDISTWQGDDVDFNKIKASGINHVIIRAGFGETADNQFENNYAKARAAGMTVGVYWFSYASSVTGAEREAAACLKVLNGRIPDMPVYYDMENDSVMYYLGKNTVMNMACAFCDIITKAGCRAGVYSSISDYGYVLDPDTLRVRGYSIWCAHWAQSTTMVCDIWQYSDRGFVSGINDYVDMNRIYNLNIVKL